MAERPHFFDLEPDTLADVLTGWGMPPYRAGQLLRWVYQHGQADPSRMTDLPQRDRQVLADRMRFLTARIDRHQVASDGVQKLLMDWDLSTADTIGPFHTFGGSGGGGATFSRGADRQTECVMIPENPRPPRNDPRSRHDPPTHKAPRGLPRSPHIEVAGEGFGRKTACVSSQIGCPVGCVFCASGLGGLTGNLTRGQIVEQVWRLGSLASVERMTHVVFMGMGEPLANYDQVAAAVRTLIAGWGLGISPRRITVSTVGLPANIRRLADSGLGVTLAISLHAPDDELRRQLIPWARHVSIDQLISAGVYYFQKTGREVTLEYVLLGGVNDHPEHAQCLARIAGRLRCNVNLIRYNPVDPLPYARPTHDSVRRFQSVLRLAGVNAHIRASRGRDIDAACGQLRYGHRRDGTVSPGHSFGLHPRTTSTKMPYPTGVTQPVP